MAHKHNRRLLHMVSELHKRGYQRLRIAPRLPNSNLGWYCDIAPASSMSYWNGAFLIVTSPRAFHAHSSEPRYFDWPDAQHASPSELADIFIARFSEVAQAGKGSDWLYAGWYLELLHLTHPDAVPICTGACYLSCLSDDNGRSQALRIVLPPPGEAGAPV